MAFSSRGVSIRSAGSGPGVGAHYYQLRRHNKGSPPPSFLFLRSCEGVNKLRQGSVYYPSWLELRMLDKVRQEKERGQGSLSPQMERRKSSKRLQNAKLGCIQGEEASQSGCSADSPNINASPAARPSNSGSCPNLNDAPVTGHANAEENNIGPELSRNGAAGECSDLYETPVTESADTEKTTTGKHAEKF
ncbi:hypothetical protein ACET3Z_020693 [Daucus carota]